MLNSWILVISKAPSYLYLLLQETKPYGTTVAELATALFLILSSSIYKIPFLGHPFLPYSLGS